MFSSTCLFNGFASRSSHNKSFDFNPNGEAAATLDDSGICLLSDVNTHNYSSHMKMEIGSTYYSGGNQNFSSFSLVSWLYWSIHLSILARNQQTSLVLINEEVLHSSHSKNSRISILNRHQNSILLWGFNTWNPSFCLNFSLPWSSERYLYQSKNFSIEIFLDHNENDYNWMLET